MKKFPFIARYFAAVLGWVLFFYWWKVVYSSRGVSFRTVTYSLTAVAVALFSAVLYSVVWIHHNKRVARRGKRGLVSFYKAPLFDTDAIGRKLKLLSPEDDRTSSVVMVVASGKDKIFTAEKGTALGTSH